MLELPSNSVKVFNYKSAYDLVNPVLIDWDFYQPYTVKEPPFSQIGLAVYLRTYSRYIPELKRREKWCETVLRVVEYSLSLDTITPVEEKREEALELFDAIFNLRVFPAGRALWIGGTEAVKRTPTALYNCSFSAIDSFSSIVEGFYLLLVGAGFGFSIEEKYIGGLPSIEKGLKIKHIPYQKWVKGSPDTVVNCDISGIEVKLSSDVLSMSDGDFRDYIFDTISFSDCQFTLYVGDSKEGWCTALKFLLWAYAEPSIDCIYIDYAFVRPKGTPLKTFGGRASGHEALQEFFQRIETIVNEGTGDRLSSTQILDICNAMGAAVVVGGVRRSSEIALGDMNDEAFINAKRNLWSDEALADKRQYRTMSNNSVILNENPGLDWFQKVMDSVRTNGEPGFVSIGNANKKLTKHCEKSNLQFNERKGVNPCSEILLDSHGTCVSSETQLITRDGIVSIGDAVGKEIEVWNGVKWAKVTPFVTGYNKPLYRVKFSDGTYLDTTDYHGFSVKDRFQKDYTRVSAVDLMGFSKWAIHTEPFTIEYEDGIDVDKRLAYTMGVVTGDGCAYFDKKSEKYQVSLELFGEKMSLPVLGAKGNPKLLKGYQVECCAVSGIEHLLDAEHIFDLKNTAQGFDRLFSWKKESILAFVAGLADTDGSQTEHGGIRVYLSGYDRAYKVALLLTKCGIKSSVNLCYQKGDCRSRYRRNKDLWYVQISSPLGLPCHRLNASRSGESKYKGKNQNVRSVEKLPGLHTTYCFTEPERGMGVFGNTLTYQCNLSEINVAAHVITENGISFVDGELLTRSIRLATRIGSRMTLVNMFHPEWDATQKRDRLLGVSLTGIMTACDMCTRPGFLRGGLEDNLDFLFRDLQKKVNAESFAYHDHLGIPRPLLATCIKPSGTLSLLPGVSPGIHRDYAPYYLRRVRVSKTDPVAHALRSLGIPCAPENGQGDDLDAEQCKTWVFTFPIKTDAPIRSIDEPAIEQLDRYKTSMRYWTQHNTSVTISVADNEWDSVANWLYENYDDFVGVSFLPKFDSHNSPYPQLPMESCDREKYEDLAAKMPKLTEEEFIELIASKEVFYEDYDLDSGCATGACPVR